MTDMTMSPLLLCRRSTTSTTALASQRSTSRTVDHGCQPATQVLYFVPALRVTAVPDRARSSCGPAGRLALVRLPVARRGEPLRCRGVPTRQTRRTNRVTTTWTPNPRRPSTRRPSGGKRLPRLTVPEDPRLLSRFLQSLRCPLVGQAGLARRRRVQLLSGQEFSYGQDLDARMLAPR